MLTVFVVVCLARYLAVCTTQKKYVCLLDSKWLWNALNFNLQTNLDKMTYCDATKYCKTSYTQYVSGEEGFRPRWGGDEDAVGAYRGYGL